MNNYLKLRVYSNGGNGKSLANQLEKIILILFLFLASCSSNSEEEEILFVPNSNSSEDITKYIAEKKYLGDGWIAETSTPREATTSVSPHGRVRVFFNSNLLESLQVGNGTVDGPPHSKGSMAVKELYEEDVVVGHAVLYHADSASNVDNTTYYCVGPLNRCIMGESEFSKDRPAYGIGTGIACGVCHGGLVFTEIDN